MPLRIMPHSEADMYNVFSLTTLALLTTSCAPKVPAVEVPAPEPVEGRAG